jgi:hypothetical protein
VRLTHKQKEDILDFIKIYGTLKTASQESSIPLEVIKEEIKKSAVFRKRVLEARQEGKQNLAEQAIDKIREYALTPPIKTDRNQLTAAIALANAYEVGFRGTSKVEGHIEHDVKVITAVPRPKYEALPEPVKQIDKPKVKTIKKEIRDDNGEIIGYQTVEEAVDNVIEGEFIEK